MTVVSVRITESESNDPKDLSRPRTKDCEFWLAKRTYLDTVQDILFIIEKIKQLKPILNKRNANDLYLTELQWLQELLQKRRKYRNELIRLYENHT